MKLYIMKRDALETLKANIPLVSSIWKILYREYK